MSWMCAQIWSIFFIGRILPSSLDQCHVWDYKENWPNSKVPPLTIDRHTHIYTCLFICIHVYSLWLVHVTVLFYEKFKLPTHNKMDSSQINTKFILCSKVPEVWLFPSISFCLQPHSTDCQAALASSWSDRTRAWDSQAGGMKRQKWGICVYDCLPFHVLNLLLKQLSSKERRGLLAPTLFHCFGLQQTRVLNLWP